MTNCLIDFREHLLPGFDDPLFEFTYVPRHIDPLLHRRIRDRAPRDRRVIMPKLVFIEMAKAKTPLSRVLSDSEAKALIVTVRLFRIAMVINVIHVVDFARLL